MSQIFEIDGRAIAFGQRWYHLTGEDAERREISRYAKDAANTGEKVNNVTIIRTRGVACGFFQGDVPKYFRKKPLYSAAAVFAAACGSKNALLTYAVDDLVAVIGIKDGLPDPETDGLISLDEAVVTAQKFIQENGDRAFSVFDNAGIFTDAQQFDFGSVKIDATEKHLQVLPLSRSYTAILALLILAVSVPLVYYGFVEDYLLQKKREEAARQQVDPVQAYLTSARAALVEELPAPAKAVGTAYEAVVNAQPMYKGGWVLQSVECTQGGCVSLWANQPWGTHESFLADGKDQGGVQLALTGTQIREQLQVQLPGFSGSATPEESLPPLFNFLWHDITTLQHYRMAGLNFNLRDAIPFGVAPGAKPPADVPGGIVLRGEWKIDGPMGVYGEALRGLPDNMALRTLTVQVNDQQVENSTFVAEGYYYVRSR